MRIGRDTPAGQVITRDGGTLTDSPAILRGLSDGTAALAPLGGIGEVMGGYKGYGYAAVVEILSAALQQGKFLHQLSGIAPDGKARPYGLGHFFMAIACDAFLGEPEFRKTAGDICRELRASQIAPGESHIYTAGEKEHNVWLQRQRTGLPINAAMQTELLAIRDDLELPYRFPFEK